MTDITLKAYPHQAPVIQWFEDGHKHAFEVWHRRAGKDRVATFIESMLACQRVGLYWHALPEFTHARRVVWDALTRDGERLIDISFPPAIRAGYNEQEMKIALKNGSIWQLVGADQFNRLVGANPVHVTFSEFALTHPNAREFVRPILAENAGSELLITTPRGYNHAHKLWERAKKDPKRWHTSLCTAKDTGIIPKDVLERERQEMPDEMFRQEWMCDWSAANVGSILGKYIEAAEREGRINTVVRIDPHAPIHLISDIGFRDTAAWWFMQPRPGGFACFKYLADSGMDAEDWIEELHKVCVEGDFKLNTLWLPHDARAKTFRSKRTVVELFLSSGLAERVEVVPALTAQDKVNAARMFARRCHWHQDACAEGLEALRGWEFKYNEETRTFSKEPDHNWASHGADAFAYAGSALAEYVAPPAEKKRPTARPIHSFTLDDAWATAPTRSGRV